MCAEDGTEPVSEPYSLSPVQSFAQESGLITKFIKITFFRLMFIMCQARPKIANPPGNPPGGVALTTREFPVPHVTVYPFGVL